MESWQETARPKQKNKKKTEGTNRTGQINNKRAGRKKEPSDSPEIPDKGGGGGTSEELCLPSSQKND